MRSLLLVLLIVSIVGCKHDTPEQIDLNKNTSDSAEKIMKGEHVDAKDVIPKDGK